MSTEQSYRLRKQMIWGVLLIVVGGTVLLDHLGVIDVGPLWRYSPLLLVVFGLNQLIGPPSAREFGSGLWLVFIGLWLFAVHMNAFGLTYGNSWPLFILAWGVKLLLDPFISRRFPSDSGS